MSFFLFITIILSINPLNDKELKEKGIQEFSQRKFEKSILTFKQLEQRAIDPSYRSYAQFALGHIYGKELLDFRTGILHLKKALPYIHDTETKQEYHHLKIYNLLGDFYYSIGKIDSAEFYLKEGLHLYFNNKKELKFPRMVLTNLDNIFYRKHEYEMSKSILSFHSYHDSTSQFSNYIYLNNSLSNYAIQGDSIGLRKIVNQIENLNIQHSHKHLFHIGKYYSNKNRYDKAINYYLSFLEKYRNYLKNDKDYFYSQDELLLTHFFLGRTYLELSDCYKQKKEPKQQIKYLELALSEYCNGHLIQDPGMKTLGIQIYNELEKFHQKQIQTDQFPYLDNAKEIIEQQIVIQKDTNEIIRYELIFQNHLRANFSKKIKVKEEYYWKAYLQFKKFINHQHKDEDQLFHFKDLVQVQEEWVEFFSNRYLLTKKVHYLIQTLEIIENSKANILKKRDSKRSNPNFRDYLNSDYLVTTPHQNNETEFLLSEKLLKNYFKNNYTDKAFISYFNTDDIIYIVSYHDEKFYLEKNIKSESWKNSYSTIKNRLDNNDYFIDHLFHLHLNEISDLLLPQWTKTPETKRIVVSNSKTISSIPLEILKTNHQYLIENFAVSYTYSLHHEYKRSLECKNHKFDIINTLAVAPYAHSNLIFSEKEVKWINADYLLDDEATFTNLTTSLKENQYNVLHFATHSTFDKNPLNSFISLFPNPKDTSKLYFNDINNIELINLDLVVLSSCKSANGIYLEGEGNMSLQRAFIQASVPSVIAGVWNVNDQFSSQMMAEFYKNLKKGWEKDIALQNAKIHIMEKNCYVKNNPLIWGSLVLHGNIDNIVTPTIETKLIKFLMY
ncbi:CHAT domain-containing protein [Flammeovirga sp. EKP202]|uniref:CHAT domain-containing protein n=1 Tax=Flammeovirga sp. EKP202 TaxID=2770592 RepID=UPI00165F2346|nr:CHAT domain-containing protein [Flammeovirga sp. EKP202]MBD0402560.1 CHAT domain-containing protein [Flammeovirga sp. EKP202]